MNAAPARSIRLLMFGWEYPPDITGGLGMACRGMTRGLAQVGGIEVALALPRVSGNEDTRDIRLIAPPPEAVLRAIRIARRPEAYARGSAMEWVRHYDRLAAHVVESAGEFDLIHAHDWLTAPAAMTARALSGKPLLLHIHSTEHDRAGSGADPAILAMEKEAMDAADMIVAVSETTRRQIISRFGQPAAKVHVVHNGIDAQESRVRQAPRQSTVSFVGRVTYQKGPLLFIEAAAKALERRHDLRFVMAGDGDLLKAAKSLAKAKGLAGRIDFPGFLGKDDLGYLLERSSVVVMPSRAEPFGLVALEAIEAGVPVIVAAHAGVAELLKHVVKVDPEDTVALATAMVEVCADEAYADRLRTGSQAEIATMTWASCADRLKSLYRTFLNPKTHEMRSKELIDA
ncbi:glycosyltransferase family 4 protein [Luteibacter sp. PPL554]